MIFFSGKMRHRTIEVIKSYISVIKVMLLINLIIVYFVVANPRRISSLLLFFVATRAKAFFLSFFYVFDLLRAERWFIFDFFVGGGDFAR